LPLNNDGLVTAFPAIVVFSASDWGYPFEIVTHIKVRISAIKVTSLKIAPFVS
jgi:hypothetical protein